MVRTKHVLSMFLGCCMIVSRPGRRISRWLGTQLAKIRVEVSVSLPSLQAARNDVQAMCTILA
jgi:hypothetical protein